MDKKSILAIEKIITYIMELDIMTKDRDDNYFYNSYEMPIICGLVNDIEINLKKINFKVKEKYNDINWKIFDDYYEKDDGFIVRKLGKIWILANGILKKELYNQLRNILEIEIPIYYTNYCNQQHEKAVKQSIKERNVTNNG